MKITFLGAARMVTGSCFHVRTEHDNFLIDCGLFQGQGAEEALNEKDFPFDPAEIDFILLTHAHIDHSGRIPKIFLDGFKGEVIATKPTTELCAIMLPDSGHIQEFEAEWKNRKRARAGKEPIPPLYTLDDAVESIKLFRSVKYDEEVQLTDTLKVRFNDAGHILGSSILEIWLKDNGRESKLVFTGDLGNKGLPILRDPTIIREADYLIIESTYGNKIHKPKQDNVEKFINIIYETMQKGGNIIIPSFAVGRTQEVIYELNKHVGKYSHVIEQVLHIPVFVDSPLAISATEVFRKNLDCYDEEAREYIENGDNPLDFPGLTFTKTAEESIALNTRPGSAVIISASGMCEAGRIKHHLKHNLWRKECSVVFVGYQAPGTLGRKIADGAKMVRIFGEEIEVDARVEVLEGFSGHADRDGLLEWIRNFEQLPKKLFIVHGEEESMLEFAGHIKSEFPCEVIIPSLGETYKLEGIRAVREAGRYRKGDFKRLEIISILENLKEEFDEVSSILKEDLSLDLGDNELDSLKSRLMNIEESLIKAISR